MGRCFWRGSGKGWFPHCKRTTWSSWTIWPRTRCRASARPSKLRVPAPVSAALFARFQPHRKHVEQDQANPPQPGPAHPGRTGPGRSNGLQRHLHRRLPRLLFTRSLRYMICGNTLSSLKTQPAQSILPLCAFVFLGLNLFSPCRRNSRNRPGPARQTTSRCPCAWARRSCASR